MSVTVCFKRIDSGRGTFGTQDKPGLKPVDVPSYQTNGAAGIDLHSAQEVTIPPGLMRRVSTGFNVKVPEGFVGFVCSRSGLAFKHMIAVLNAPGVVDCDYTGELFVMLVNHGEEPVTIRRNDRVAQLVVLPVARVKVETVGAMPETERGGAGFGSTGGMPREDKTVFPVIEDDRIPEGHAFFAYPKGSPLNRLRTDVEIDAFLANERAAGRLGPLLTPERAAEINAEMADFRRDHLDPFREKFMRLTLQDQEKVLQEAGLAFERLGPYGPVTPSRVNRVVESLNLTPEEAARILPQLEKAEAEALEDPKNQQLIADAMEKQRQPYSIGQKGV